MAETETAYLQAIDNLELYSDKIREMFLERAGEDGIVDMNRIGDLMNDLNSIIGIDLGKAKKFFSKDNDNIPTSFNLDATTFEDFIELLKIWIHRKAGKRGKQEQEADSPDAASLDDIPTVESRPSTNRVPKSKKKKRNTQEDEENERKKTMSRNIILPPNGYKRNRERLDELLLKHREEFNNKFYERQDEATEKISTIDFLMFLNECFAMDNVLLKERVNDEQDFFQSNNSYETLMKIAESYFLNVRGADANDFEIKQISLTFNECFDILDHWFQIDDSVALVRENEKLPVTGNTNNGQSEVRKVLLDTIAKYKVMVEEANSEVERQVLQGTIDTLYQKLSELDGGENEEERRKFQNRNNKKREEKKMKALKEIFEFYAKQQLNGVKPVTFANLEKQFKTISIGKFSVILKNFKMKIDNFKLKELFKKIAVSDDLNFDEFYALLQKISKEVELVTETKQYKPNPEIMKEYRPDCYKKSAVTLQKETAKDELSKRTDPNNRKNDADKLDEMWEHMGVYNGAYRSNMQLVQLAFNTHEKESFRIDPESIKNKNKKLGFEEKISEEIKEDIAKRNRLREVIKDVKRVEKNVLRNYQGILSKQDPYYIVPKYDSYAQQAKKEKVVPISEKKMTLKDIGNSKYSEMKDRGFDPKFNPHDLIEENDDEDNYYLAEYSLTVAARPQVQMHVVPQSQKDDLEQYKANELISKVKTGKRQSMAVDGRYSRLYESKAGRGGTLSPNPASSTKSRSKPHTSDENLEYSKNLPSMSGLVSNPNKSSMNISQSTKNLVSNSSNPNLRNYGHIYESVYDSNTRASQPHLPRPEKIDRSDPNRKPPSGVLDRVSKIQQDSKKREYEIMNNLINIQNNKLEQGLRVARR